MLIIPEAGAVPGGLIERRSRFPDAPAKGGTDPGRRTAVQIAAAVGGVLLVAVVALGLFRRLSRRRRAVA